MSTDLTLTTETARARDLQAAQYELIRLVAGALHQSRYYQGISSEHRAAYLMARAYELGFPATAAPDVIDDINGRLTLKPQAALALVYRSGLLEDMRVKETDDSCTVEFKRVGLPGWHGYTFTMTDAKKAELIKQGGAWEKWTKNMLYWRAVGFAIDRAFPDVTMGLKDSVQFGAEPPAAFANVVTGEIVADGEVIDGEVS
jgi:hypothetical protein